MNIQRMLGLGIIAYVAYSYLQSSGKKLAMQMPDGSLQEFAAIDESLNLALLAGGQPVIVQDGAVIHNYTVTQFGGGWLLDNCPLNVILGQGWFPGQQEALAGAGLQPYCP